MKGLYRTMPNKWMLKDETEKVTTEVSKQEIEQMRKIANVDKQVDSSAVVREYITLTLKK
tara:strand:+ start:996 stop:1175 length:180 start_codon:yes stop_codon:yes gene_type:complete